MDRSRSRAHAPVFAAQRVPSLDFMLARCNHYLVLRLRFTRVPPVALKSDFRRHDLKKQQDRTHCNAQRLGANEAFAVKSRKP